MNSDRAVLSIDLEWFAHTPAYRSAAGTTDRDTLGLEGIEFLLNVLDEWNSKATFFIVSEIGETSADVLREIATEGHEIASHTHTHRLLTTLDKTNRQQELSESRRQLQEITGEPVTGFRAPAFDLPPDHFGDLDHVGYEYDSSIAPCRRIPGWYGGEYSMQRPCQAIAIDPSAPKQLAELPIGVMPGLRLPLTGAWLRFFGVPYTILGMKLLARRGITPVLYVHPWELVDLPAVKGVPKRVYWRTGKWTREAIKRILAQPFAFVTARSEIERTVGE